MPKVIGWRGSGGWRTGCAQAGEWYRWGPYVSERQWGTVREDYSADGEAWDYLPHDHARSRAYRWGEDGLAGFCDVEQRLCLGLALWNGDGPDPEGAGVRADRRAGQSRRGRQGVLVVPRRAAQPRLEPVALPLSAGRVPLSGPDRPERVARTGTQPEYELLDTGVFDDDRYWIIEVHYAKASADDLLMTIQVTNAGPDADDAARAADRVVPQHLVLGRRRAQAGDARPTGDAAVGIDHPFLGALELLAGPGPDGTAPTALFCENETNDAAAVRRARRSRRTRRTASTTTWCTGRPPSTRSAPAPSARSGTR